MKIKFIYLILLFFISCDFTNNKKVYLTTNHSILNSFNYKNCKINYEFVITKNLNQISNNSQIISVYKISDSIITVKTHVKTKNAIKTIGNLGHFNLKTELKSQSIEEFIFKVYQKSWGDCN